MPIRYNITDGPAAHDIWDHAKHSQNEAVSIPLRFTTDHRLAGPIETSAWLCLTPRISGVQHEDGSGQSLIITGMVDGKYFRGIYNARRRNGYFEVVG